MFDPREKIAVFIDHLEDGHAMSQKAIAAAHPRYGQQAVSTSTGRLVHAGHLRWIHEHLTIEDGSMRWVTRTYWSRTPRPMEWWKNFAEERDGRDVTEHYQPGLARVEENEPADDRRRHRPRRPSPPNSSSPLTRKPPTRSPARRTGPSPNSAPQTPVCRCPTRTATRSNPS